MTIRHLTIILLALAATSCEREEISYPSSEKTTEENTDTTGTPSNPYDEPYQPTEDNTVNIAKKLCGEWHGQMKSRYTDDYGMIHHKECATRFSFSNYGEGTVNGIGNETDSVDGKRVFFMSYSWYISNDEHIHLRYEDKIERHISTYILDSHSFSGKMETSDGLEECNFTLSRIE